MWATRKATGFVTVSLGATTAVSSLGGTIKMPEGLLLMADSALYKAKHKGRNRTEASIRAGADGTRSNVRLKPQSNSPLPNA